MKISKSILRRLKVHFKFPSKYDISTAKRIWYFWREGRYLCFRKEKVQAQYRQIPRSITYEELDLSSNFHEEMQKVLMKELKEAGYV